MKKSYYWATARQQVLLCQTSSAAVEKVLKDSFDEEQGSIL